MPYDPKFMQRALALSATSLDTPGTQPFGAVVVRHGEIVDIYPYREQQRLRYAWPDAPRKPEAA